MSKFIVGIFAIIMMLIFQVNAQVVQKENLASGFIVKTVEDEEGIKVVLKSTIVYSSSDSNLKLKSVHISNQEKNYITILNQLHQAKKNNQYIRINKKNNIVEIDQ
ncbi:MAG: hypothetical protein ACK4VO_13795 [Pseudobdellovibrio sp.]